jgi:hypothetical protein
MTVFGTPTTRPLLAANRLIAQSPQNDPPGRSSLYEADVEWFA